MTWAWDQDVGTETELLVLLALADRANDDGESCFPGNPEVARKARVSVRSVPRIADRLEARGLIKILPREGRSNEYKLNVRNEAWPGHQMVKTPATVSGVGDDSQESGVSAGGPLPQSQGCPDSQESGGDDSQESYERHLTSKHQGPGNGDAVPSSPVGSAGEGQPTGSEPEAIKPPAANAGWKAVADKIRFSFTTRDFEKIIEPLTAICDADGVLTLGALSDQHVDQFSAAKALDGRSARQVLADLLGRQIEVRVWTEVTPEARQRASAQRRSKRLMGRREQAA